MTGSRLELHPESKRGGSSRHIPQAQRAKRGLEIRNSVSLSRKTPSFWNSAPAIQSRRQSLSHFIIRALFYFCPTYQMCHYSVQKANPQSGINTEWATLFFSALPFHTCLVCFRLLLFFRDPNRHITYWPFIYRNHIHLRNPRSIGQTQSDISFSQTVTKAILVGRDLYPFSPAELPFPSYPFSLLFAGFPLHLQPIPLFAFPIYKISISISIYQPLSLNPQSKPPSPEFPPPALLAAGLRCRPRFMRKVFVAKRPASKNSAWLSLRTKRCPEFFCGSAHFLEGVKEDNTSSTPHPSLPCFWTQRPSTQLMEYYVVGFT